MAVHRPIRGVIDLVLERADPPIVACEAHSDLRRLEQQVRWARAKSDALAERRRVTVSRLLLLRATADPVGRSRVRSVPLCRLPGSAWGCHRRPPERRPVARRRDRLVPGRAWSRDDHEPPPRGIRLGR
jgi:hypothetical protein